MNANYSHATPRGRLSALLAGLVAVGLWATAAAALHAEHSLRYVGWLGWKPVTVEVTLRKRAGDLFEYREWVAPRWWAALLGDPVARQTTLRAAGSDFRPVAHQNGTGTSSLEHLEPDVVDLLAVRLEARADLAAGRSGVRYRVWQEDGRIETWTLERTGTGEVDTPDGRYQCLTFRLGNDARWIRGWSAPLLAFHFVRLEFWEEDRRIGSLDLESRELWE